MPPITLPPPLPLPLPDTIRSRQIPNVNGMSMHILEAGFPDVSSSTTQKPVLLLLHGFPELAYSWRHIMPALASKGYHVIAPDQRGYGRTTGWTDSYDCNLYEFHLLSLVDDLLSLLLSLDIKSVHAVIGHDFGSPIASLCALSRPDVFKAMVVMSAPFPGVPNIKLAPVTCLLNLLASGCIFGASASDQDVASISLRALAIILFLLSGAIFSVVASSYLKFKCCLNFKLHFYIVLIIILSSIPILLTITTTSSFSDWSAPLLITLSLILAMLLKLKISPPQNIHTQLESLQRPRKHYQKYFSTRPAASDFMECKQGLASFFRSYFCSKSYVGMTGKLDPALNIKAKPAPLKENSGEELSKLPEYYVMDYDRNMAETVEPFVSSITHWFPESEVNVYAAEFKRVGFNGSLAWYRSTNNLLHKLHLLILGGLNITVPATFIGGKYDFGLYQTPGAMEKMPSACKDWRGVKIVDEAGHWVQQEKPEEIFKLILEFLEGLR